MAIINNLVADTVFTFEDGITGPVALRAHGMTKAMAKVESWLENRLYDFDNVEISWNEIDGQMVLNVYVKDELVAVGTLSRGAHKVVFTA